MTRNENYVAIDIAKNSLQVQAPGGARALDYDRDGLERLESALAKEPSGTIVVCEATGGYERRLVSFLRERGRRVALVNPARVRDFARSEGLKAKTDPIDAGMLLRYAREKRPGPSEWPSPEREDLAALMDRRSHLSEMLAREKNRLQNCPSQLSCSINRMIAFIEDEMARLDRTIRELVASSDRLRRETGIMLGVTGVGEVTAWSVSAYLGEITRVDRRRLASLAGLAPFNQDSGLKQGRRAIQGGRRKIRNPLYMAATAAAVHNPHIREYVQRLRFQRQKPYKCAITAAMRKLLIHMQSLLKNHEEQLA